MFFLHFQASLTGYVNLGKVVASVRYQLLRQQLTIRIVSAKELPKMGIQGQPSEYAIKLSIFTVMYPTLLICI